MSKECTTHHHACDCREEKFKQLERENAALRSDVYQCPPTSENDYEGFKWRDACEELERDNAALRELTSTLGAPNHINIPVEKWRELREDKERLDWMASADYWADIAVYRTPQALRAAIDAARKEAQP